MKIWLFRCFYEEYPGLTGTEILYAPRKESRGQAQQQKLHAPRGESGCNIPHAARDEFSEACENSEAVRRKSEIPPTQGKQQNQQAVRDQLWTPGHLHPNLSRNHYHKGAVHIKTGGRE